MNKLLFPLCALAMTAATTAPRVYEPAEAVALAKEWPRGKAGRFGMTVVATGVTREGTFLNSNADYRADDNLSIRLSPAFARKLARQYGAPADVYFKGKRVVVAGVVANQRIGLYEGHKPPEFLRMQHVVALDRVGQLISIE